MVILDTNVLSESFRPNPSPNVAEWLRSTSRSSIYTTSVTMAEVLYGIEALPDGRRRQALAEAAARTFDEDLAGRILDFDEGAALAYARIMAERRSSGRPMSAMDAMIAAIAMSHRAMLATRNTRDFDGCGLRLVNPFGD